MLHIFKVTFHTESPPMPLVVFKIGARVWYAMAIRRLLHGNHFLDSAFGFYNDATCLYDRKQRIRIRGVKGQ